MNREIKQYKKGLFFIQSVLVYYFLITLTKKSVVLEDLNVSC